MGEVSVEICPPVEMWILRKCWWVAGMDSFFGSMFRVDHSFPQGNLMNSTVPMKNNPLYLLLVRSIGWILTKGEEVNFQHP